MNLTIQSIGSSPTRVEVNSGDSIQQVKERIKEINNIDVNEQELFFGNQKLENVKTLKDYNIVKNEQIRLVESLSGGFQIYVNNLGGRAVPLQVKPSYTIERVKALFQTKVGMSVNEQRYVFNARELLNHNNLSYYEIKAADTITLVTRLNGGC